MTEDQLSDLTPREQQMLLAQMRQRDAYKAMGHGIAAFFFGLALKVQLQVLKRVDAGPDTQPFPLAPQPLVRRTDSLEFLVHAINRLPEPDRQAMRLKTLSHKSTDEVAAELGMPVAEAEHLLSEAALKLRKLLSMSGGL